jgi:hypothetical protein
LRWIASQSIGNRIRINTHFRFGLDQNAPPRNNVPHPSPFELGIEQNKPIFFDDFYCIY